MKLDSEHIAPFERSRKGHNVFRLRRVDHLEITILLTDHRCIGCVVRMSKIHIFDSFKASKQSWSDNVSFDTIPAHMRNFLFALGETLTPSKKMTETGPVRGFGTAFEQPLHADTNAEE